MTTDTDPRPTDGLTLEGLRTWLESEIQEHRSRPARGLPLDGILVIRDGIYQSIIDIIERNELPT